MNDDLRPWHTMLRLGSIGAWIVVCLIPIQAGVFMLNPPPDTVREYFDVFQTKPILGLLDLDLLLIVDYLMMVPLYLAVFLVVRRRAPSAAVLGLVASIMSVTLFLVSRDATFSMWSLSSQFAQTTDPAEQAALIASGQTALTLYNGGTFAISYLLGAAAVLLFSWPMWRHRIYGRAVGLVGIITGLTMLVPANFGALGMVMAMLSLIPTVIWLVLLARALARTARAEASARTPDRAVDGAASTRTASAAR